MITLGAITGAALLIAPAFMPQQSGGMRTRFDEIVSAQQRGAGNRLGKISPKWVNPIDMKDDVYLRRAIKELQRAIKQGVNK